MKGSAEKLVIAYKLLAEILVFVLAVGAVFLVAEIILPGFISDRINFSTFYWLLIGVTLPLILVGRKLHETRGSLFTTTVHQNSRGLILFISVVAMLFLASDVRRLASGQAIAVLGSMFLAIYGLFFLMTRKH